MKKYYYCPICGNTVFDENIDICPNCKNHIHAHQSIHDVEYYRKKSIDLVGNYSYAKQILIDEEISQNPLYNPNTEEHNATIEYEVQIDNIFNKKEQAIKNQPKCPTCGSTNIKPISKIKRATHGYAFGLFSKTARSQFECLNCHYKW